MLQRSQGKSHDSHMMLCSALDKQKTTLIEMRLLEVVETGINRDSISPSLSPLQSSLLFRQDPPNISHLLDIYTELSKLLDQKDTKVQYVHFNECTCTCYL